jgi:hypothetical protein
MSERPSFEPSEAKDFKIYDRPDEKPYFEKFDHKKMVTNEQIEEWLFNFEPTKRKE